MRLFVAVPLSPDMQRSIMRTMQDLQRQGIQGRYVQQKNLHMTLVFLGDLHGCDEAAEILHSVPVPAMKLRLSSPGQFRRVLWLGVSSDYHLHRYVKDLRDAFQTNGLVIDHKEFVPHITMLRGASGMPSNIPVFPAEMQVGRVSLVSSQQRHGRVVYTERAFVCPPDR